MIQALLSAIGLTDPPGGPKPAEARSPHWPACRAAHLHVEPECQCCGTAAKVEVHHVRPYHLFPAIELDDSNLITLCDRCHLFVGHLGLWRSWNALVRTDASRWRAKIKSRP